MSVALKYFTILTDLNPRRPGKLIPLLSWKSGSVSDATPSDRIARTTDISEADFVVAPRVLGSYVSAGDLDSAKELAAMAAVAGKPFILWHTGDLEPVVPDPHWILLVNALSRSRRKPNWFVAPHFIEDPLVRYEPQRGYALPESDRPRVGFCGYASSSYIKLAYSVFQNLQFRLLYLARLKPYEPPPLIPATRLRSQVLSKLRARREVQTEFIARKKYRTGPVEEFYRNILETDYTVCVRGYGNWSRRFYETLACGRIPILIDTDCGLPFDQIIDWRQYCVWVPEADVARVADYVLEFHSRRRPDQLRELQQACRWLWETYLSLKGFLDHFGESVSLRSHLQPTFLKSNPDSNAGVPKKRG